MSLPEVSEMRFASRALALAVSAMGFYAAAISMAAEAKPWMITKVTTSNTCHVLPSTASLLGEVVSRHDSRKEACSEALALYDETLTEKKKCFTYGKGTVDACEKEGVKLPK
jgi:hypothetical protein